jgi:DAK2 domain fusion protein YloV
MGKKADNIKHYVDGMELRRIFLAATVYLEQNVETVNSLNVFPVPDGDTGTNMLLTMREVNESAKATKSSRVDVMARAMSNGALRGSRGNSGVILSQFFHGIARGLDNKTAFSGQDLIEALRLACEAAYTAVSKPVEGTMLTVIRGAAETTSHNATPQSNVTEVWEIALAGAKEALQRTPDLLPILREAGVVDSGGLGITVLLEGGLCALKGENLNSLAHLLGNAIGLAEKPGVRQEYMDSTLDQLYGYCIQLLLSGSQMDVLTLQTNIESLANSTVVVGDSSLMKIHTHSFKPDSIVGYVKSIGTLEEINIEDIDEMHNTFITTQKPSNKVADIGVVAVSQGLGLDSVLRSLGVLAIVPGGQSMNPSTQEILQGIDSAQARQVIVLPNNPNVTEAARQASGLSSKVVNILPSNTIPQGIAAMLSFSSEEDMKSNIANMENALATVRTAEITKAVRSSRVNNINISTGQTIGLIDGTLVAACDSDIEALKEIMSSAQPSLGSMITLYWGADATLSEAEVLGEWIHSSLIQVELDLIYGGQPHYRYIISIE